MGHITGHKCVLFETAGRPLSALLSEPHHCGKLGWIGLDTFTPTRKMIRVKQRCCLDVVDEMRDRFKLCHCVTAVHCRSPVSWSSYRPTLRRGQTYMQPAQCHLHCPITGTRRQEMCITDATCCDTS